MLNRRRFLMSTAAAGAAGFAALHLSPAFAQDAPQIQIFVPAAPGGGWDQTARTMDQVLRSEKLISGSQITNVGGAGGTVGLPQFISQWNGKGNSLMVAGMVMVGAIIANKSANNLTEVTPIARLTGEFEALVVP
ncbi:MAG: tripartite tricarboxylate transporter substrate binding protein, partial [Mesorhizobium sp.]